MPINVDFRALWESVRRMGAAERDFSINIDLRTLDPIDIELGQGIAVGLEDVEIESGLLHYKGRQILLYIPDHGPRIDQALANPKGKGVNRFHVCDCRKLQEMRERGRYERYVATNDLEGDFEVYGVSQANGERKGIAQLAVCMFCLERLNYKGYQGKTWNERRNIPREFSLEEFFSTYSSYFRHMPSRWAGGEQNAGYTDDWPEISGRYKAEQDFQCEKCGVSLKERAHRRLLHVHHKNGVKTNNQYSNLIALCADCHRKEPYHAHMHVPVEDTRLINRLRSEQTLMEDAGWDEVLEYADPAMEGLLLLCRDNDLPPPVVGHEITDQTGAVVAELELAWPDCQIAVPIRSADRDTAEQQGWEIWRMDEAIDNFAGFSESIEACDNNGEDW